ncbi:MAG: TetR family transcriptional regulator [Firmicutes bacterium]|nr:TetR family transcriptional regulator [Bacillota bacterium]
MRRTKEEAAQTRQTIIDVAEVLFTEKGYETTSLDDIASAAGLTRGAVYWHFQNKQGLLLALRQNIELPLEKLAERLSSSESIDPLEVLSHSGGTILRELQSNPRRRKVMKLLMQVEFFSEVQELVSPKSVEQHAREVVTELLRITQHSYPLKTPWTPETGALVFTGLLAGAIIEWSRGDTNLELIPDVEEALSALLASWYTRQ